MTLMIMITMMTSARLSTTRTRREKAALERRRDPCSGPLNFRNLNQKALNIANIMPIITCTLAWLSATLEQWMCGRWWGKPPENWILAKEILVVKISPWVLLGKGSHSWWSGWQEQWGRPQSLRAPATKTLRSPLPRSKSNIEAVKLLLHWQDSYLIWKRHLVPPQMQAQACCCSLQCFHFHRPNVAPRTRTRSHPPSRPSPTGCPRRWCPRTPQSPPPSPSSWRPPPPSRPPRRPSVWGLGRRAVWSGSLLPVEVFQHLTQSHKKLHWFRTLIKFSSSLSWILSQVFKS